MRGVPLTRWLVGGSSGGDALISPVVLGGTSVAGGPGVTSVLLPWAPVEAGQIATILVPLKYPGLTVATPAGFLALPNSVGTGGFGSNGADSGSVIAAVFIRVCDGTESGNVTITISGGSANTIFPCMDIWENDLGHGWTVACVNGADQIVGTAWSVTFATDPGIRAGDYVIAFTVSNRDGGTTSAEAISTPGVTYGATFQRRNGGSSNGDDIGRHITGHPVTAGVSSGNSVFTATYSITSGNSPAGVTVLAVLRAPNASGAVSGAIRGGQSGVNPGGRPS